MRTLVFGIFDEKISAFMQPFFSPARGHATRLFSDLVNDGQSMVSKHPADYRLFCLGEFNDQDGQFKSNPTPELLCVGSDFREAAEGSTPLRSVGR